MGTFLLFLLIIFFTIIILGLTFLRGVVRLFIKRPSANNGRQTTSGYREYQNNNKSNQPSDHQKVFTKNEGEYIDFEEIKV